MKHVYKIIFVFFLFIGIKPLAAQDLRITRAENIPDTSLFSNSFSTRFYFQFSSGTLTPPFKIYFNYAVNGMVQNAPLDSFTYSTADTNEQSKDIMLRTDSPVYRKGDNIVVVWPICNQVSHSLSYYRKHIYVTDSLNTGIEAAVGKNSGAWNSIFDQSDKKLYIENTSPADFPIRLKIYDTNGRMIYKEELYNAYSSALPELPSSIYLFELKNKAQAYNGKFLMY